MKKITFLALVSLVLTVIPAQAAMQNDTEIVTLPEFRVTTTRYTEAEKSVRASLAAFRETARPANHLATELPDLGTVAAKADAAKGSEIAAKPVALRAARS